MPAARAKQNTRRIAVLPRRLASSSAAGGDDPWLGSGHFDLLRWNQRLRTCIDDAVLAFENGGQFLKLALERLAGEDVGARAAAGFGPDVKHVRAITGGI